MGSMFRYYQRQQSGHKLLAGAAILIIVLLLVCVGVLLWKYQDVKKDTQSAGGQTATQDVVAKVNKIYLLPKDDKPTVAQIKDKSKLTGNDQFYKDAQDGDYVLVYGKAKLALLYREPDNRLISVMPISLDQQNPSKDTSKDSP